MTKPLSNPAHSSGNLTSGLMGYLTPEASVAHQDLVKIGVDADLALVVLEMNCPETAIYQIPEENRSERKGLPGIYLE